VLVPAQWRVSLQAYLVPTLCDRSPPRSALTRAYGLRQVYSRFGRFASGIRTQGLASVAADNSTLAIALA